MARLACPCLNVTVHYKGLEASWDARPVEGGHVLPARCGHRLCGVVLYEVDLDMAGVTTVRREGERGKCDGWSCCVLYYVKLCTGISEQLV